MLREYELTVIFSNQNEESAAKEIQRKYEEILLASGGEVLLKDTWGLRKLSYPIKKQYRGYYVHYDLICSPDSLKEAERLMRMDEKVLRYLPVCISHRPDAVARKVELEKLKITTPAKAASGE